MIYESIISVAIPHIGAAIGTGAVIGLVSFLVGTVIYYASGGGWRRR